MSRTERNTQAHEVAAMLVPTTVDVTLIQPQKAGQCCLTPSEEEKEGEKLGTPLVAAAAVTDSISRAERGREKEPTCVPQSGICGAERVS